MRRAVEAAAVVIAIAVLGYTTYQWGRDVMRDLEALARSHR